MPTQIKRVATLPCEILTLETSEASGLGAAETVLLNYPEFMSQPQYITPKPLKIIYYNLFTTLRYKLLVLFVFINIHFRLKIDSFY